MATHVLPMFNVKNGEKVKFGTSKASSNIVCQRAEHVVNLKPRKVAMEKNIYPSPRSQEYNDQSIPLTVLMKPLWEGRKIILVIVVVIRCV